MNPIDDFVRLQTRRQILRGAGAGLGAAAVATLAGFGPGRRSGALAAEAKPAPVGPGAGGALGLGHFAARAKRVIYLFMAGAPSQLDLFDYKPGLRELYDTDLPPSIRKGQRLTTMTSNQARFPIAPTTFAFAHQGQSGAYVSDLLPHTAKVVDDLAFIKSMWTEAINHDPAITFCQTGSQIPGRPSIGAWVSYGLGSVNRNLPDFVVLNCKPKGQALYSRLWGSGFLSSKHAGVAFRSSGDPVLYLSDPPGVDHALRRQMLDSLQKMNEEVHATFGDPETRARIAQYEMAFRMQSSVPELTDISGEPQHVLDMYGPEATTPGTFGYNCLLARRMAERDVRFVQIFHRDWDHHGSLPTKIREQCKEMDQPAAALIQDLKQRGLLKDTLVVWGGEFGRTVYSQGTLTKTNHGRDHHPRCFTVWLAGGGVRGGVSYGATDDFSYNITSDPVHIRDLNATILHQLGIDHERFTVRHMGLDQRLTGVEKAHVVKAILG
jgi:hypothetical protein